MPLADILRNRVMLEGSATNHPRGQATLADWQAAQQRNDASIGSMTNFLGQRNLQQDQLQNRYLMALLQQQADREAIQARLKQQQQADLAAAARQREQITGSLRTQDLEGQQRRQLAGLDANEKRWQAGFNAENDREMAGFQADENRWQTQFNAEEAMKRLGAGFDQEKLIQQLGGDQRLEQMMLQGNQQVDLSKLGAQQQQQELAERFRQAQSMSTQDLLKARDQGFQQQLDELSRTSHRLTPQGAQTYGKIRQSLGKLDEAFKGGKGKLTLEEYLGERQKIASQVAEIPWDSPEYQMPWGDAPGDTKEYGNRLYIRNPDGTYKESGPSPSMNAQSEWEKSQVIIRNPDTGKPMALGVHDYNGNLKPIVQFEDPSPTAMGGFDPSMPVQQRFQNRVIPETDERGVKIGAWTQDDKGNWDYITYGNSSGTSGTGSRSGSSSGSTATRQQANPANFQKYLALAKDLLTDTSADIVKPPDPNAVLSLARDMMQEEMRFSAIPGDSGNGELLQADPRAIRNALHGANRPPGITSMDDGPGGYSVQMANPSRGGNATRGNGGVLDEDTLRMMEQMQGTEEPPVDPRSGFPQPTLRQPPSQPGRPVNPQEIAPGTPQYSSLVDLGLAELEKIKASENIPPSAREAQLEQLTQSLSQFAVRVANQDEARRLPPGTLFVTPDGNLRRIPK